METFVLQMELAWPRQPLFNYLADIENNVDWQSQVLDSRWIGKCEERTDSAYKETWLVGNEELELQFNESLFWPLARRAFVTTSAGVSIDVVYHFVDRGSSTLFKIEVRAGRSIASPRFVEWLRATYELNLLRLKTIIDSDNEKVETVHPRVSEDAKLMMT